MPVVTRMEAALGYALMGMPVAPLWPNSKIPKTEHGVQEASTHMARILTWWRQWPDADVALACGERAGFDVLDVDPQHGGFAALARFAEAHGPLPATAWQRTPSGGFHLLFRHEPGLMNWSGGQGLAPRGLDCRTNGAMIRTWPTRGYHWVRFTEPGDLPSWPACIAAHFRKLERSGPPAPRGQVAPILPPV